MESDKLRLIHSDREKIFEDEATIGDQEVANDDVVYVVYKKGESTEFESVSAGGKEDAWTNNLVATAWCTKHITSSFINLTLSLKHILVHIHTATHTHKLVEGTTLFYLSSAIVVHNVPVKIYTRACK